MNDRELDRLSHPMRVAVAAACVEHILDFYRFGDFSFRVKQAPGSTPKAAPDDDLVEHGLAIAWSFAETGKADSAAVDAVLQGFLDDSSDPEDMCAPGLAALGAAGDLMRAISDATPAQASRAMRDCTYALWDGIASLHLDADDKAADGAKSDEQAWQRKVLQLARELGRTPPSRQAFAELIAEDLPWRKHMDTYRRKHP